MRFDGVYELQHRALKITDARKFRFVDGIEKEIGMGGAGLPLGELSGGADLEAVCQRRRGKEFQAAKEGEIAVRTKDQRLVSEFRGLLRHPPLRE